MATTRLPSGSNSTRCRKSQQSNLPKPPADLWEEVAQLNEKVQKQAKPGPEWFTAQEYADRFGVSKTTAQTRLTKLRQEGAIEAVGGGSGRPAYFRVKR